MSDDPTSHLDSTRKQQESRDAPAGRHVLAVVRGSAQSTGGIRAFRNVSPERLAGLVDGLVADPHVVRCQVVEVDGDGLVRVVEDRTFRERIDHPEEDRRQARLDDPTDPTVHDVYWGERWGRRCPSPTEPCRHPTEVRR